MSRFSQMVQRRERVRFRSARSWWQGRLHSCHDPRSERVECRHFGRVHNAPGWPRISCSVRSPRVWLRSKADNSATAPGPTVASSRAPGAERKTAADLALIGAAQTVARALAGGHRMESCFGPTIADIDGWGSPRLAPVNSERDRGAGAAISKAATSETPRQTLVVVASARTCLPSSSIRQTISAPSRAGKCGAPLRRVVCIRG